MMYSSDGTLVNSFQIEITEKRLDLQYINNYVAWQAFI